MFSRPSSLFAKAFRISLTKTPHQRIATLRNMSDLTVELTAPNGKKYTQPTGLFINNEWVPGSKGDKIVSINPTDESEIAAVHAAEAEDVDKAVVAARAAFNGAWRDTSPTERGDMLYKLSQLVEENKELLATIETWDNGVCAQTSTTNLSY